ncbi:MAG: LptF/LptG family permease [Bacteroidetes bacterium]|nr:LptF/LptG family permease [Bacteroidota bacterium]
MLKKLDTYIIKTFLTTFLVTIGLFSIIIIVFDISEKLDDFLENKAPLKEIVFDYYFNFIPQIMNMFSPIFVFVSVIFFTSKMAQRTEIVSILASGISYRRFLRPYILTALMLGIISFFLNGWLIPHADKKRADFENKYTRNMLHSRSGIHRQIKPDVFLSIEWFSQYDSSGTNITLERYKNNQLVSKTYARRMSFNYSSNKWQLQDVFSREYNKDGSQTIHTYNTLDTAIRFNPADFFLRVEDLQTFDNNELNKIINAERERGSENVYLYTTEKYRRMASPFSTFILTIIGVCVSSKKSRGGIGVNLGFGIGLSFGFLFIVQFFNSYGATGLISAPIAVSIPNILYLGVAWILYKKVQK